MKKFISSKKQTFILATLMILFSFSVQNVNACTAGGPGSSSCSASGSIGTGPLGISYAVSVSCGDGYYACCTVGTGGSSASCIANQER